MAAILEQAVLKSFLGVDGLSQLRSAWGKRAIFGEPHIDTSYERLKGCTIAQILSDDLIAGSEVRIIKFANGEQLPEPFAGAHVTLREIERFVDTGYSVMIKRAGRYSNFCRDLKRRLSTEMGCMLHDNLFISPANGAALSQHADEHHTLNLQISGAKNWKIYSPVSDSGRKVGPTQSTDRIADIVVRGGTGLYVPSGFPHEVFACDEGVSISLAYAVAPPSLARVVELAIRIGDERGIWRIEDFEVLLGSNGNLDGPEIAIEQSLEKISGALPTLKLEIFASLISEAVISAL